MSGTAQGQAVRTPPNPSKSPNVHTPSSEMQITDNACHSPITSPPSPDLPMNPPYRRSPSAERIDLLLIINTFCKVHDSISSEAANFIGKMATTLPRPEAQGYPIQPSNGSYKTRLGFSKTGWFLGAECAHIISGRQETAIYL